MTTKTLLIRRMTVTLVLVMSLLAAVSSAVFADHPGGGGRPLTATLSGAVEGAFGHMAPGDPDGSGFATIFLNQGQGEICFELTVQGIDIDVTSEKNLAHIHDFPVDGPTLVIGLTPLGEDGTSHGCVGNIDANLIKAIRQNPSAYYINVHNDEFYFDGAVRGLLSK